MGLIEREGNLPAEVVRRQYIASAAGDLDALRATLAPDVEWTEMAGFPLAGTYRTPEGVTSNVMEVLGRGWELDPPSGTSPERRYGVLTLTACTKAGPHRAKLNRCVKG